IVAAESFATSAPRFTQQILSMKSKGADTLVIFAPPTPTITSLVTAAKVGWTPTNTFVGNVSANRLFMLAAAANGANVDGVISSGYLASSTTQKNLAGVQLAGQIIDQYAPSLRASFDRGDANVIYGFAV